MTFVDHGLIFNLNLPWYNHGAPEYVKNKYHGLLIKYGRCTYILRTWYFHCQIWLTGYAMVARLTVFRHVKMVSCWIMVSCYKTILWSTRCFIIPRNTLVFHDYIIVVTRFSVGQPSYNAIIETDTNMVHHVSTLLATAGKTSVLQFFRYSWRSSLLLFKVWICQSIHKIIYKILFWITAST